MTQAKVFAAKVIGTAGQGILVEFTDRNGAIRVVILPRAALPPNLKNGAIFEIEQEALDCGIEYGLDFGDLISPITITPIQIQNALRSNHIYTLSDLISHPQQAQDAVLSLIRAEIGKLLRAAIRFYNDPESRTGGFH